MRRWFGRASTSEPVRTEEAAWAAQDVAAWNGRGLDAESVAAEADRLVATAMTVYRLDIAGPSVTMAPKGDVHASLALHRVRVEPYRRLLQDVVRLFGIDIHAPLILEAGDMLDAPASAPVFALQRRTGDDTLLLPDIELIESFNTAADVQDDIAWSQKSTGAIFTGSTTGGWSDVQSVREHRLPRLAAAEHFRGSARVRWELPNIVQCASPETVELIRSLGLGAERRSWRDQFAYRVLLSMDGNGATCSRVSIGLASRCVLAKFASPHVLYYFRALEAGKHYVHLDAVEDVDRLLDDVEARPQVYELIAEQGRAFAQRHLTRLAAYAYTGELLIRYAALLRGEEIRSDGVALTRASGLAEVVATTQDGQRRLPAFDAWAGTPRSGRGVRSLALHLAPRVPPAAVRLCGFDERGDKAVTTPAGAEAFALDGGLLHGVSAEVDRASGGALHVALQALFVDGYASEPCGSDIVVRSPSGAPLEAIRLSLTAR